MLNSDFKIVYNAIIKKSPIYARLQSYYLGHQPVVWLTSRLKEIFADLDSIIVANWAAVVVDACQDRINLREIKAADSRVDALLQSIYKANELSTESTDAHAAALITSEAFIIVWPSPEDPLSPEIYYNDPSLVHAVYYPDRPRVLAFAGKLWDGEDGARGVLYYPDRLEYYRAERRLADISSAEAFNLDASIGDGGVAVNPYNRVPVFHFRLNRYSQSDLINVIPLQDGINKLLADMMAAAEYGAFKQRWIISNADVSSLKNAPNTVWEIPAGDDTGQASSVGEFSATDLGNYLDAIDRLSRSIGTITQTPRHYFMSQGGDPSGEALIAMEAPLNHKAQDRIDRFIPVWRDVAVFALKVSGVDVDPEEIEVVYERPETVQPRTAAEITKIRVDSQIPVKTALRWEGKSDTDIEMMEEDEAEQKEAAGASLAAALMKAEEAMKSQSLPTLGRTEETQSSGYALGPTSGPSQEVGS